MPIPQNIQNMFGAQMQQAQAQAISPERQKWAMILAALGDAAGGLTGRPQMAMGAVQHMAEQRNKGVQDVENRRNLIESLSGSLDPQTLSLLASGIPLDDAMKVSTQKADKAQLAKWRGDPNLPEALRGALGNAPDNVAAAVAKDYYANQFKPTTPVKPGAPKQYTVEGKVVLMSPEDAVAAQAQGKMVREYEKPERGNSVAPKQYTVDGKVMLMTPEDALKAQAAGRTVMEYEKPGTSSPPTGQSWRLSGGERVISYDGGRTYTGTDGTPVAMPQGAVRFGAESGVAESRADDAAVEARKILSQEMPNPNATDPTLKVGLGPWAKAKTAIDSVLGGVTGVNTLFADTADARKKLALTRNTLKSVFTASDRPSRWEQEQIDSLFPNQDTIMTNPDTELRKLSALMDVVQRERTAALESISSGVADPKELTRLQREVREFDKVLRQIGDKEAPASAPNVPSAAIEALRQNPHRAMEFDAKYGKGASKKILGK